MDVHPPATPDDFARRVPRGPGGLSRRTSWILALGVVAAAMAAHVERSGAPVLAHLASRPGDFSYNFEAAARLVAGESPFHPGFAYPPVVPLLYSPLVALDREVARFTFYVLSQLALVGSAVLLMRPAGGGPVGVAAVGLTFGLAGTLAENLALGQLNPWLLLSIAAAMRWMRPSEHPRPAFDRAAAALGIAAALKVWPGLLLGLWGLRRRWRGLALALLVTALLVVVPLVGYRLWLPPPHHSVTQGFWMGTPALLNFSLPASVLRATYGWSAAEAVPRDWESGVHPAGLALSGRRRALAVAASLTTLIVGVAALIWRLRAFDTFAPAGRAARDRDQDRVQQDALALAYLTVLAVIASPISWYHYQLFLIPGVVLLGARALRGRRAVTLVATLGLLVLATWAHRMSWLAAPLDLPQPALLVAAGVLVPVLDFLVLGALLHAIARPRPDLPAAT